MNDMFWENIYVEMFNDLNFGRFKIFDIYGSYDFLIEETL